MKKLIAALAVSLTLAGCAAAPEREPATPEQVQSAIEAADAARKQAASVGHEWRDTGKFIDQARKLLKEGKLDEALALAEKAQRQGELGYKQWQTAKSHGLNTP